jgi:hypothetical protein
MEMERVARWAFIAFVIIAVVMGLVVGYLAYNVDPNRDNIDGWVTLVLLILGIIIGFTSITVKEVQPFLIAAIALVVVSIADVWLPLMNIHRLLYDWAVYILQYITAFAAPAAVIIAIKSVLQMAKDKT